MYPSPQMVEKCRQRCVFRYALTIVWDGVRFLVWEEEGAFVAQWSGVKGLFQTQLLGPMTEYRFYNYWEARHDHNGGLVHEVRIYLQPGHRPFEQHLNENLEYFFVTKLRTIHV